MTLKNVLGLSAFLLTLTVSGQSSAKGAGVLEVFKAIQYLKSSIQPQKRSIASGGQAQDPNMAFSSAGLEAGVGFSQGLTADTTFQPGHEDTANIANNDSQFFPAKPIRIPASQVTGDNP